MASHSLGTRLKAERESRGFTLVQIAESTKIPAALLQALERNDLSRWPKGLYRRAFFRSYVTALGLPPEPLVAEFTRLFPDDTESPILTTESVAAVQDVVDVPPLALSWAGPSTTRRGLQTVAMSLLEVVAVAAIGGAIAWASGVRPFEAIGAVALTYLAVVRLAGDRIRRLRLGRRRRPDTRLPVEIGIPVPESPGLESSGQPAPVPEPGHERWRPAIAALSKATGAVRPVAERTGRLLQTGAGVTGRVSMRGIKATSSAVMRVSRVAGAKLAIAVMAIRRLSSRGFAAASHAFWKGVRAAAEHAELLASRQLNRRVMDPPSD